MKKALVLGASGQDGSILCEELVLGGRDVLGLGRRGDFPHALDSPRFRYVSQDLSDSAALAACLRDWSPDEIYHVAAVHGSAGFQYEPVWGTAVDVNVKALHAALEHARCCGREVRVFYASSAKIFGALRGRIGPETPKAGDCLYAITKRAAGELAAYYRRAHGVMSTVGILFNHESDRREPSYFIPKICRVVGMAKRDRSYRGKVATLSFCCDWSSARDFMRMAVRALEKPAPGELIFASGVTWQGKDFVEELFKRHGLDYRDHLEVAETGPAEPFAVDMSETRRLLSWDPKENIFDVCAALIEKVTP